MRIQLEQLDLLHPWPELTLAAGYHAMRVLVFIGAAPVGEVIVRPVRTRRVTHRRLAKRIAHKHGYTLLKMLAREGLAAGADSLAAFAPIASKARALHSSPKGMVVEHVQREILNPLGLPSPYREWVMNGQPAAAFPLPPVTVAICTRDRPEVLAGCVECLQQLDYPELEILVIDNSQDPVPTRDIAERAGVTYVRAPKAGLSRARNAAMAAAATRWVAFTDDDCRPERNWLKELVRPLQDTNCRCVTGLVLPAQLENAAEITFEVYGGLGRGYHRRVFDRMAIGESRVAPVQTWGMGAGANMLLDGQLCRELGGYDEDMGPGGVGGCGEDTDVFYLFLRAGHSIHYTPKAIVLHYHRSSPAALRKQIYSYAKGHAAYHWRCLWAYRDYRSLIHLLYHMPKWFARNAKLGMAGKTKYPFSLVSLEVRGTLIGPVEYTLAKAKRFGRSIIERLTHRRRPLGPVAADPVPTPAHYDAVNDRKQSSRVA